jgi:hypothetical protein
LKMRPFNLSYLATFSGPVESCLQGSDEIFYPVSIVAVFPLAGVAPNASSTSRMFFAI